MLGRFCFYNQEKVSSEIHLRCSVLFGTSVVHRCAAQRMRPLSCVLPGDRDDAWPGDDLMEFFQLKRLYDFSMRALEKPSAYLKGVPGDTTLYRCAI